MILRKITDPLLRYYFAGTIIIVPELKLNITGDFANGFFFGPRQDDWLSATELKFQITQAYIPVTFEVTYRTKFI